MPLPLILLGAGLLTAGAMYQHHQLRPRKVFFSFHYADIWRVNQVKKSWLTHRDNKAAGFFDRSLDEVAKTKGAATVRNLIDDALDGTEVTVGLVGSQTSSRRWVKYEIEQSALRGNGLLAIDIHNQGDRNGYVGRQGKSPFANFTFDDDGLYTLDDYVPKYDWALDEGYENLGEWLRSAPTLQEIMRKL
jgi:hypothetical protein